ncbi:hypothetical protein ACSQ67_019124 [Phaseolus vulgaris]
MSAARNPLKLLYLKPSEGSVQFLSKGSRFPKNFWKQMLPKKLHPPSSSPSGGTNSVLATSSTASKSDINPSIEGKVVVMGLCQDRSVLDLKSRFEIYDAISRIGIDHDVVGYITYGQGLRRRLP